MTARRRRPARGGWGAEMPFPVRVLEVGESLWWGAPDPRTWGDPVQWFTDSPSTARAYMDGRYGEEGDWATMYFDVRHPAKLVHMRDWKDLGHLAVILGIDPEDGDPREVAPALCDAGYDGWWIDEGDHYGADVMLCTPRAHVAELHIVDQGDGWTGEDPRPNPAASRGRAPRRAARTLFHGTLRAWERVLRAEGLRPMIGATVRSAYDVGAGARPLVFAAATPEETRAAIVSQIAAATGKSVSRVTRDDVARLGMIVEVPARGFVRARAGTAGHPAFVEDEDWYTDRTVSPSGFWTAEMMRDLADGRRVTPLGDGRTAVRENPRARTGGERTDPALWRWAKAEAVRRLGGRHSARAMQTAGALYRAAGGRYRGPPTAAQRSLAKWTREDWTTATGARACRPTARGTRCDRYLPRVAWQGLTPAQAAATRRAKLRASSQYVPNTPAARAAGRWARTTPRQNPGRPLRAQLAELRPQMAAAAQVVYDDWNQDEDALDEELGEGGICDRVAEALWGVIGNAIPDAEIRDGGWEGDDHAYLIVQRGRKAFAVDIPPEVYETGGGYSWRKRKGVQFTADDVVIEETDVAEE